MKKGYLYILITAFFFSTMEIALKVTSNDFNPIQITFLRFFVGGLFLLPFGLRALHKADIRLKPRDFGRFALLGFCSVVVSMSLFQMAVNDAEPAAVATLFSSNPVFIALCAYLLLREPFTKFNAVALALEVVGIVFIINPLHTNLPLPGIIFTLLATMFFALYGAAGTTSSRKFGGLTVTSLCFLFGSIELLAIIGLGYVPAAAGVLGSVGLGQFVAVPLLGGLTANNVLIVLYVCIGVTGLGYGFWFLAMQETSATETSVVFFIKPVLAPILAVVLVGETIPQSMIVGIAFILAGSGFMLYAGHYTAVVSKMANEIVEQREVAASELSRKEQIALLSIPAAREPHDSSRSPLSILSRVFD